MSPFHLGESQRGFQFGEWSRYNGEVTGAAVLVFREGVATSRTSRPFGRVRAAPCHGDGSRKVKLDPTDPSLNVGTAPPDPHPLRVRAPARPAAARAALKRRSLDESAPNHEVQRVTGKTDRTSVGLLATGAASRAGGQTSRTALEALDEGIDRATCFSKTSPQGW